MIRFIPRRYWAVIAVALALTMSVLDGTIVNVALPTLSREFGTSPSSTIWIVNAYQLTITMSLLSFSALGDIYGYKRIFLIGTTIFCSTSLFCALSSSFAMLTVARILQGIGASAIMSVTTALLRIIYPPQYIGRGMSINAMVVAVSIAAGPSLAGAILSVASWNWLFAINVPLGICAIITGYFLLPQNPCKDGPKRKFDKIGGISNALTFGLLIYSLEGIAHHENSENDRFTGSSSIGDRNIFYPQATTAGGSDIAIGLDADSDIRLVRIILDYFIYGTVVGDGIITFLFAKCSRKK